MSRARLSAAAAPPILCLLLSIACLLTLPSLSSAGLVSIAPAHVNSTAYHFTVELEGPAAPQVGADGTVTGGVELKVLIEPEEGNATEALFMTMPSPMTVEVNGLQPNHLYTFTFSVPEGTNTSTSKQTIKLEPLRTHRIGPAIIGFFAADPDGADTQFSAGDEVTMAFDIDTNQPGPTGSADEIQKIFSFSQPLGAAYSGEWRDARTFVITIADPGQSAPMLGYLTATVIGDLKSPDGLSDVSVGSSPPLIGSWATRGGSIEYFRPTDPQTGEVIENPDYNAYHIGTQVNTDVVLPMSLQFPAGTRGGGFMVSASILYPKDVAQLGFVLNGKNFSYAPSANIGTQGRMTNEFLAQIVPTLTLTPKPDYVGYACVSLQLFDMAAGYRVLQTAYVNVRIDPPPRLYVPELTASSSGRTMNPIDLAKEHKTPLIIGLSVLFGALLVAGLSVFAWKRCRAGRDAKDFESGGLTADSDVPMEAGPTRRFYYDAKV